MYNIKLNYLSLYYNFRTCVYLDAQFFWKYKLFDYFACYLLAFNPPREISIFGKGAGFVDFVKALDPGLVYDYSFIDYVRLLGGLDAEGKLKEKYEYNADGQNPIALEDLNYPSIMVVVSTNCLPYKQSITCKLTCIGPTFDSYKWNAKRLVSKLR